MRGEIPAFFILPPSPSSLQLRWERPPTLHLRANDGRTLATVLGQTRGTFLTLESSYLPLGIIEAGLKVF